MTDAQADYLSLPKGMSSPPPFSPTFAGHFAARRALHFRSPALADLLPLAPKQRDPTRYVNNQGTRAAVAFSQLRRVQALADASFFPFSPSLLLPLLSLSPPVLLQHVRSPSTTVRLVCCGIMCTRLTFFVSQGTKRPISTISALPSIHRLLNWATLDTPNPLCHYAIKSLHTQLQRRDERSATNRGFRPRSS